MDLVWCIVSGKRNSELCHVLVQRGFGYRKCSGSRCVRLCHAWGQTSSGESVSSLDSFCTFEWWICFLSFLLRHAFFVFCCWWAACRGGWVWLLSSTHEWLCLTLTLQAQCYPSTRPDETNVIVESKNLHSYGFGTEKSKLYIYVYNLMTKTTETLCLMSISRKRIKRKIFSHDPVVLQTMCDDKSCLADGTFIKVGHTSYSWIFKSHLNWYDFFTVNILHTLLDHFFS